MQGGAVWMAVSAGIIGGLAVGLQAPFLNMLGKHLGSMGSAIMFHFIGSVLALALLPLVGGANLGAWREVPWYAWVASLLAIAVVIILNFAIPQLGVARTLVLFIFGQLLAGILIDQFGLFGVMPRAIDLSRLTGIAVLLFGSWLVIR